MIWTAFSSFSPWPSSLFLRPFSCVDMSVVRLSLLPSSLDLGKNVRCVLVFLSPQALLKFLSQEFSWRRKQLPLRSLGSFQTKTGTSEGTKMHGTENTGQRGGKRRQEKTREREREREVQGRRSRETTPASGEPLSVKLPLLFPLFCLPSFSWLLLLQVLKVSISPLSPENQDFLLHPLR